MLKKIVDSFKKAWRGEERISVVFWGWGVVCQLLWVLYCLIILRIIYKKVSYTAEHGCNWVLESSIPAQVVSVIDKISIALLCVIIFIFAAMLFKYAKNIKNNLLKKVAKIFVLIYLLLFCLLLPAFYAGYLIFAVERSFLLFMFPIM
jgi:hypothetical protein